MDPVKPQLQKVKKKESYTRTVPELSRYINDFVTDSAFITNWIEVYSSADNRAYIKFTTCQISICHILNSIFKELRESNLNAKIIDYNGTELYVKPSYEKDILDFHE